MLILKLRKKPPCWTQRVGKGEIGHATILIFSVTGCASSYNDSKFKAAQRNEERVFP